MLLSAAAAASHVFAQSIDLNSPTPVTSNEVSGRIAPLDIGDSRATRFFYTFNGLQGDLELTVESNNLDGDIDIFLASNLRPLTKVTLYAGGSASRAAKTVYLRREEPLIMRVQARTPNDAEGTYRIRLGGAFRPAARLAGDAAAPVDETTAANSSPARSADRKVRRVSSVGARIEEPVTEVAGEEAEKSASAPEPPPVAEKRAPATTPRSARTRTPTTRRTTRAEAARKTPPKANTGDTDKTETSRPEAGRNETGTDERAESGAAEKPATSKTERARPVRVPRARNSRSTTTARRTGAPPSPADAGAVPSTPAETSTAPPEAPGARLVLVMRDGETFVRNMSSVRRVTVERGMLLIVSKNGTVERQPMSSVLRMSIEP